MEFIQHDWNWAWATLAAVSGTLLLVTSLRGGGRGGQKGGGDQNGAHRTCPRNVNGHDDYRRSVRDRPKLRPGWV